jgi:hypothetical protein
VRLIYADWLDDRGLPGDAERAEFVRFQVRLDGPVADFAARLLDPADGVWTQTPLPEVEASVSQQWQWRWRRGFVEAISLSLADFEAHAARLFATQPIQYVTLTDKEPTQQGIVGETYAWLWGWVPFRPNKLSGPQQPYHLPGCLYDALQGYVNNLFGWRFYRTQEEAQEALAQACVRWGRQQAGLLEGVAP